MGMAASQMRLLMLTARIHDVEYQAQQIQSAKLQLATQEDEVYRAYTEALDATTLTFTNDNKELIPANFNNLCGLGSITNGLNKNYVFRTGDNDRLIVPTDVYNGYKDYNGNDPYEFAMFMLGVDIDSMSTAESIFVNNRTQGSSDDPLVQLQESIEEKLRSFAELIGEDPDKLIKDTNEGQDISFLLPSKDSNNYSKAKELADGYLSLKEEFRHKLYNCGAKNIYEQATGESEGFDQDKFNYYVRWAKLIEQEVGIEYCTCESDYTENFGNDSDMLNQMLQSGRILVDVVKIDSKSGKLTSDTTTVASDSNLAYTATTTIDKKALAKAEAEYEHAMKKIDKKDKQYDMELNKLETERTALTTEYDSVKKVISENIERTFGIFS
jgi:hypothetical protein